MGIGIWEHINLASIILTAMFGILFPAVCIGAWKMSVRGRGNTHRIENLEEWVAKVESLPKCVAILAQQLADYQRANRERQEQNEKLSRERNDRNERDHDKIFVAIERGNAALIREFHKGNGNNG